MCSRGSVGEFRRLVCGDRALRYWYSIVAVVAALLSGNALAQATFSILSYDVLDDVQVYGATQDAIAGKIQPSRPSGLSFTALGQLFELELESNEAILRDLIAAGRQPVAGVELYRGKLAGNSESWLRLTRSDGELIGIIWDGRELYGIEPAAHLMGNLPSKPASASATVIYRWSDTIGVLGDTAAIDVGVSPKTNSAVTAESLSSALDSLLTLRQLDIGLVADVEFTALYGLDTEAELLARANNIDGIFAEQVGIHLVVAELQTFNAEPDPFSSSTSEGLLQDFADYKQSDPALASQGAAQLFSGRSLAIANGPAARAGNAAINIL